MLHRLRLALKADAGEPFAGAIEADETYVGGKQRATVTTALGSRKPPTDPPKAKQRCSVC